MRFAPRNDWPLLKGRWLGLTVVCIASGPSLMVADADLAQPFRTIVVNTTFRAAPWADIVYSNDEDFYEAYLPEIRDKVTEHAQLWCGHERATELGLLHIPFDKKSQGLHPAHDRITWGGNSGFAAIGLAHKLGATTIILLGYDQQWEDSDGGAIRQTDTEGKLQHPGGIVRHFHGDHPSHLKQGNNWPFWREHFEYLAVDAKRKGIRIINSSRRTSLTCFERLPLEEALQCANNKR